MLLPSSKPDLKVKSMDICLNSKSKETFSGVVPTATAASHHQSFLQIRFPPGIPISAEDSKPQKPTLVFFTSNRWGLTWR